MSEPVDTSAEAVRIIGYRHEIQEPGREPLLMFSQTPANPWSHWLARHLDTCQYTCVPLVAASALTAAQREIADLRNRLNLSEKLQGRFPVDAVQPDQKDVS